MSIPDSFIQDLLARADVVEVVGRYVQLKKAGANYQGLCPFHGEKTPSFSVSPTKQFFHCFGCGKSGNAIGFLMEHLGMGFVEAVEDLAGSMGLPVPKDERSPADKAQAAQTKDQQSRLVEALERAARHFSAQLPKHAHALGYVQKRGLSEAIVQRFQLGYAPEGWRGLAAVFPDYSAAELTESGLVIEKENETQASTQSRYDRFRDRVMFPIRNLKGQCIGFGGRVLDKGEPKYLNSPETPVFSKGRELYGLFEGRSAIDKAGYALVTEGYMDVVALAQMGFENTVATLGTACTPDHIQKLLRVTNKVVFSFDGDAAGRRAAHKAMVTALPFAADTKSFHFLFLPAEHDPDSYIREHGADAFARMVTGAIPLSQMLLGEARLGCDLDTIEGRSMLASQARDLWQQLPDGAAKRQILQQLAGLVQLGQHELLDLWGMGIGQKHGQGQRQTQGGPSPFENTGKASKVGKHSKFGDGKSKFSKKPPGFTQHPRTPLVGRNPVASRIDRALGLLFVHNQAWEALSPADHAMLADWAAPYGTLFRWLERQMMEHGAQPWSALAMALQNTRSPFATAQHSEPVNAHFALVAKQAMQAGLDLEAERTELLDIMERLRTDSRRARLNQLAQEAMSDPSKFAEYKRLMAQV